MKEKNFPQHAPDTAISQPVFFTYLQSLGKASFEFDVFTASISGPCGFFRLRERLSAYGHAPLPQSLKRK